MRSKEKRPPYGGTIVGVLNELKTQYKGPEQITGEGGLLEQLTKAVMERALQGEPSLHLGYLKGEPERPAEDAVEGEVNWYKGAGSKTVMTHNGKVDVEIPRDRHGAFEPQSIKKAQRRLEGFDEKVIPMCARGITVREIQGFLLEQYKVDLPPKFIGLVTDDVTEEGSAWQNRPLNIMYPLDFFNALRVKIREVAVVRNKAVYSAYTSPPKARRRSWASGSSRPIGPSLG